MTQRQVKIHIIPQKNELNIELDPDTLISELFEYIKNEFNLSTDIQKWTCYSQFNNAYLDLNSRLQSLQVDTLTINTADDARFKMDTPDSNFLKNSSSLQNSTNRQQQFPPPGQQQQFFPQNQNQYQQLQQSFPPQMQQQQSFPPQVQQQQQFPPQYLQQQQQQQQQLQQQSYMYNQQNQIQNSGQQQQYLQQLSINCSIIDGNVKRQIKGLFSYGDQLENIADAVLAYLGTTKQQASCDLIIYGQNYNQPDKRQKTLHELQLKNEITIEARLRWIGGKQY